MMEECMREESKGHATSVYTVAGLALFLGTRLNGPGYEAVAGLV